MKNTATVALGLMLCLVWTAVVQAQGKPSEGPGLVGRITYLDGELLRYVYAEQDWVATVKDAPFGLEDALYSSDAGKAEFKLPNSTWLRIGSDTQIQLIALREDVTEVDVAAGTARFYDKSRSAVIKATTPYGYVLAQPGTAFDLYVGDESAEIICLDGTVDFILNDDAGKYKIEAGGTSIISDGKRGMEGDGTVDSSWDEWNLQREQLWTQRVQVKGESITYLPQALQSDAYELDQNGRWERVYYQGAYREFWRPTGVAENWQPFTVGRWTVWYDDNTWIPEEPFGYVTHHYGNWIYANGFWYWAPPVQVRVGYLGDCACWYPGRVAWVHSDVNVGWVPLAPAEVYYAHRYWGPASIAAVGVGVGVSINVGRLAYVNQAVIVPQGHIYSVNSYHDVRVTNINRTVIINNYRAAPVVNGSVVRNFDTTRSRYVYNTNLANVSAKPHQAVMPRIEANRTLAVQQGRAISAGTVRQSAARIRSAEAVRGGQEIQKPRISGKMVPENQVKSPGSEVRFNQRQLKTEARPPQTVKSLQKSETRSGVGTNSPASRSGAGPGSTRKSQRIQPPSAERQKQLRQEGPRGRQSQSGQRRMQQEQRQQKSEMQRQERLHREQQHMGPQGRSLDRRSGPRSYQPQTRPQRHDSQRIQQQPRIQQQHRIQQRQPGIQQQPRMQQQPRSQQQPRMQQPRVQQSMGGHMDQGGRMPR